MTQKIVQIVPRLPPNTDGVGDYSLRLAEQLLKDHHIETHFIVFQKGIETQPNINGFSAIGLTEHNQSSLFAALPDNFAGIILHYSNYPYIQGKLDAPFWLVQSLKSILKLHTIKLVVMYHELPMLKWKKINVLNPIQSKVSRQLASIADTVLTDSARFQKKLSQWLKRSIKCIPDFATIGEPDRVPFLAERKRRMIIFGSSDRFRVYQNSLRNLLRCCQTLEIEEICDIGKPLNLRDTYSFPDINLVEMGFQPSELVGSLMLDSVAGCLDYTRFPGDLGKSSVFAAFCAYGLVPFCTQYNPSEADGIEINKHYLTINKLLPTLNLEQLQIIANNANQWYNYHNLENNTKIFAQSILTN